MKKFRIGGLGYLKNIKDSLYRKIEDVEGLQLDLYEILLC
jgi:hypothetical protein